MIQLLLNYFLIFFHVTFLKISVSAMLVYQFLLFLWVLLLYYSLKSFNSLFWRPDEVSKIYFFLYQPIYQTSRFGVGITELLCSPNDSNISNIASMKFWFNCGSVYFTILLPPSTHGLSPEIFHRFNLVRFSFKEFN